MPTHVSTDVKSVAQVVKERLEGQVASFIPEEVFNKMIDTAVSNLLTKQPVNSSHNAKLKVPLVVMIEDEIRSNVNERIKQVMSEDQWQMKFDTVAQSASCDAISTIIEKHAHQIMVKFIERATSDAVSLMVNSARQSGML